MSTMSFEQSGWQVHGNVYNVAGDLLLRPTSSADDLAAALAAVRRQVLQDGSIEETVRMSVATDLAEVVAEVEDSPPDKDHVVARLETVGARLRTAGSATTAAFGLAETVRTIAEWAGRYFG